MLPEIRLDEFDIIDGVGMININKMKDEDIKEYCTIVKTMNYMGLADITGFKTVNANPDVVNVSMDMSESVNPIQKLINMFKGRNDLKENNDDD